jgi:peptidoglycan/xylan/chitin deacetylase (PgdA/CDA1 family)
MIFPPLRKLQRGAKYFKNYLTPGGLILMYHRVTEIETDPWRLSVTPKHFAQHLEVLRKFGHVISLSKLHKTLLEGNPPHRQIAITFDDGYADNLYNAKPLLESYNTSATIFLTTGCTQGQREFWWDELDRILLQQGNLPERLHLLINDNEYSWKLLKPGSYIQRQSENHQYCNIDCKAEDAENLTSPHALYHILYKLLYSLESQSRQRIIDDLLMWAGIKPYIRPTHRTINVEEMRILGKGELIEIGAHTVTHPFLSFLPVDKQREEIEQSKTYLEDILEKPVVSFAYPHGNYSQETVALVKQAGFTRACTTNNGTVRHNSNFSDFELSRVVVEDCDGDEFAKRLSKWFLF